MGSRKWFGIAGLAAASVVLLAIKRQSPAELARAIVAGAQILFSRIRDQGLPVVRLWVRDHALRWAHGMSPADTSRVTAQLFVGGQHYRHGLARMATLNITASVSLREEANDAARGVALERHLWLPTVDDTPPSLEQLDGAAQFIGDAIAQGRAVYIHCAAGVGRAPTTAVAYLVSAGLDPEKAWSMVRRTRPFIRPKASQFSQIEAYYQLCRQRQLGGG